MSTKLIFGRDVQGYNAYAPPFSKDKFSATIASNGNSTITIPSNFQNWIIAFSFEPGATCWVAHNTTAAPPVGTSFASTTSELNPGSRSVNAGDTINIYNHGVDAADVGIILYAIS